MKHFDQSRFHSPPETEFASYAKLVQLSLKAKRQLEPPISSVPCSRMDAPDYSGDIWQILKIIERAKIGIRDLAHSSGREIVFAEELALLTEDEDNEVRRQYGNEAEAIVDTPKQMLESRDNMRMRCYSATKLPAKN